LTGKWVHVHVVQGDITKLDVDVIVNAANNELLMGAGVAGAIKRSGGDEIEREAVAKGPIEIGDAVATTAGKLKAKHVVHGAVMGTDLRTDADLIRKTTYRSLEVAAALGAKTVALPAFGTGVGGFPLEECAVVMYEAMDRYLADNAESTSIVDVIYSTYDDEASRAFNKFLKWKGEAWRRAHQ
jgi:O-acetyl-ADP-ribose deacetylase (regulator of RNase III)